MHHSVSLSLFYHQQVLTLVNVIKAKPQLFKSRRSECHFANQSINLPINDQLVNQSSIQSTNHSISRPINQSICQSISRSISQQISQSANQLIDHTNNQSMKKKIQRSLTWNLSARSLSKWRFLRFAVSKLLLAEFHTNNSPSFSRKIFFVLLSLASSAVCKLLSSSLLRSSLKTEWSGKRFCHFDVISSSSLAAILTLEWGGLGRSKCNTLYMK